MKTKNPNLVYYAIIVLSAYSFGTGLIGMARMIEVRGIMAVASQIFMLYYGFAGYKKPHGNMLRYVIIAWALVPTYGLINNAYYQGQGYTILACMILAVYISGRLHKIKQNKVIGMAILVLRVINLFLIACAPNTALVPIICASGSVTHWIAIYLTYLTRYEQHKAAGLADADLADALSTEDLERISGGK